MRAHRPDESGHAAHRNPSAPHKVDAAIREPALHRARRIAYLPWRVRQPSGKCATGLKRVARFYGSDPQFICCSATIANPGELAAQLIEQEVEVVEENGAPAGEKLFVFYNPPMVNRNLGIRRSYINEATRVAKEILARKLQTIVFANSRLHTEVLLTYLQQANRPKPGQPEPIRGYRGGYLPGERREIERGLRDGRILGVVATNALELGIDVGSLDACVMAGYPGSIA